MADEKTAALERARDWGQFFAHVVPRIDMHAGTTLPEVTPGGHGLIVVGPAQPGDADAFASTVGEIARRLGWPVLADGLSPLRNHAARVPHLVTTYDVVLRNEAVARRLKPEVVLCLGGWPASKGLRAWLTASDAPMWLISLRPDNRDALHGRTRQLMLELITLAAMLPEAREMNGYQRMWARYDQTARVALDARVEETAELFEGRAVWLLARHLPVGTPMSVANSMPVRDVEYFWPPNDRGVRPFVNRGGNGIDGTLSTALGVAHGAEGPAVLLTGDLALLHDTNGFPLRPKVRGSLTIVLINNCGGGIFDHLPIAQFEPPFEEFFVTPQEADFGKLCAAYGAERVPVRDWAHFTALVSTLPVSGIRVLELRTDRKRGAVLRKQMFAEIAAGLE